MAFGQWGLTFLSTQLLDTNHIVVTEAVSILDEALEDKVRVKMLIQFKLDFYRLCLAFSFDVSQTMG